jgi:hypothetical protein
MNTRLPLILIATIALAAITNSVFAQNTDPRALAEIELLKGRMDRLEDQVRTLKQNVDVLKLEKDQMQKLLTQNIRDTTELSGRHLTLETRVKTLEDNFPFPPTPPGKQPSRDDPSPKPADGQVLSLRAPFTVKDGSGRVIFKVDVTSGGLARAVVGNANASRVELGLGAGGASVVGLYDDSNKALSVLVGDPKGSYVRVRDSDQSASLGKIEGSGLGLFMLKADKSFGEFSADSKGFGIARVFGNDGKAVGGLFAGTEGGGLALTPTGGGKSAVSLGVTQTGGKVRVFAPGGGKARAEMIAEGLTGVVNIFDSDGATAVNIASVDSKAGKIEISNGLGDIVVQAGSQKNGRGMVTTGPFEGGMAGTMGAALKPASTIVGQMKSK